MGKPVVQTTMCTCSFGAAPAPLTVTSQMTVSMGGLPVATILDGAPATNLPTFGMCSSLSNPAVAAATAAALGVLTPAPCMPVTVGWMPGCPTVSVCKRPMLNTQSKLVCAYGGQIQVSAAIETRVKIP